MAALFLLVLSISLRLHFYTSLFSLVSEYSKSPQTRNVLRRDDVISSILNSHPKVLNLPTRCADVAILLLVSEGTGVRNVVAATWNFRCTDIWD